MQRAKFSISQRQQQQQQLLVTTEILFCDSVEHKKIYINISQKGKGNAKWIVISQETLAMQSDDGTWEKW